MRVPQRLITIMLYLLLPLAFGFMTTLLTGFGFGTINNVFHIPYVLNLVNTPEFLNDAYYATLKNMTSIIWPMIRLISNEDNIERVFYIAFIVSDVMAWAGILYIIRIAELRSLSGMLLAMCVLMLSPFLRHTSIIGNCGMFIDYFNHSEVSWIFVFLSIGLLSKNKIVLAYTMAGIVFSINAFIGIWLLFINTFALIFIKNKVSIITLVKAVAGFALFALPVILWIYFAVSGKSEAVNFKFIDYIRQYFPDHFLIEATNMNSFITHIILVCSGIVAAKNMPNGRYWVLVQIGAFIIILLGIPLPYIIDNRFVFNLHLIRSAGVGQAIAAIIISISGTKMFLDKTDNSKRILGIIILLSLFIVYEIKYLGHAILLLSLLVGNLWDDRRGEGIYKSLIDNLSQHRDKLAMFCSVLFVLALIKNFVQTPFNVMQQQKLSLIILLTLLLLLNNIRKVGVENYVSALFMVYAISLSILIMQDRNRLEANIDQMPENRSWKELVSWVRTSNLHGPFLLPINENDHTDYFQLQARKQVWVDWKQGAAVMWSPSFYEQWSTRSREVSALKTNKDYVDYAQKHDIHYIVLKTSEGVCPAPATVIKRTPYYILCGFE
jgi:hypothetical protein